MEQELIIEEPNFFVRQFFDFFLGVNEVGGLANKLIRMKRSLLILGERSKHCKLKLLQQIEAVGELDEAFPLDFPEHLLTKAPQRFHSLSVVLQARCTIAADGWTSSNIVSMP